MAKGELFIVSAIFWFTMAILLPNKITGNQPDQQELAELPHDWRNLLTEEVYEYHVKPNYEGLFETDIVGLERPNRNQSTKLYLERNVVTNPELRWEGGTIPFEIGEMFSQQERIMIQSALFDIVRKTCVKFIPYSNQQDHIKFVKRGGRCSSHVGRVGFKQLIDLMPGCISKIGEIQHQVLHVLGLFHEQSRMDRDDHVTIIWSNVLPGKEDQFGKYRTEFLNIPYDYESVMHYGWNYLAKDPSKPTILPKVKSSLGNREMMSRGDVEKINRLYDCSERHDRLNPVHLDSIQGTTSTSAHVTDHRRPIGTRPRWNSRQPKKVTTSSTEQPVIIDGASPRSPNQLQTGYALTSQSTDI